jgi:hypothetical protein
MRRKRIALAPGLRTITLDLSGVEMVPYVKEDYSIHDTKIVEQVEGEGVIIDWEKISLSIGIKKERCKERYHAITTSIQRLESKIEKMCKNDEEIAKIALSIRHKCQECDTFFYSCYKTEICAPCRGNRIELLKKQVEKYITDNNLTECSFCKKPRNNSYDFHFDHKNMFDKEDSVYAMICRGESFQKICQEIEKCQVLCVSCHALVTKIEITLGFTALKSSNTRNGIATTKYNKERYEKSMAFVYDKIRTMVS